MRQGLLLAEAGQGNQAEQNSWGLRLACVDPCRRAADASQSHLTPFSTGFLAEGFPLHLYLPILAGRAFGHEPRSGRLWRRVGGEGGGNVLLILTASVEAQLWAAIYGPPPQRGAHGVWQLPGPWRARLPGG